MTSVYVVITVAVKGVIFCTVVLLSQPDSFPYKCDLLAMKSDRLMLAIVLMAVSVLVTKVTGSVAVIKRYSYMSCCCFVSI